MALLMEIMPRFMIYDTKTTSAIFTPYSFNIGKLNEPKQANKNYPKYQRINNFMKCISLTGYYILNI